MPRRFCVCPAPFTNIYIERVNLRARQPRECLLKLFEHPSPSAHSFRRHTALSATLSHVRRSARFNLFALAAAAVNIAAAGSSRARKRNGLARACCCIALSAFAVCLLCCAMGAAASIQLCKCGACNWVARILLDTSRRGGGTTSLSRCSRQNPGYAFCACVHRARFESGSISHHVRHSVRGLTYTLDANARGRT